MTAIRRHQPPARLNKGMFDFDKPTKRIGSGSYKWDDSPGIEFPLWVADMDFEVAPCITDALHKRVSHAIFGYALPTANFYSSIISWHQRRHDVTYQKEWILTVPGIVPAISAILRGLTSQGDGVLVLSPVYNCFYSSIRNLGCRAEESQLVRTEDTFRIDFEDLRKRAAKDDVKVMLLCSPHNPCGRIWTKEELQTIADICLENNVFVVADEIHCELVMPGYTFLSYSTLGIPYMQNACICTSASKAFNIAGLQNAQIICPNPELRQKIDRGINIHEVCDVNPFGLVATEAAYNEGEIWLDELCQYIQGNYDAATDFIRQNIPLLRPCKMEATYLMWVDTSATGLNDETLCHMLKEEEKLWLAEGSHYGKGGKNYLRINLATQRGRLMEALAHLKNFIDKHCTK